MEDNEVMETLAPEKRAEDPKSDAFPQYSLNSALLAMEWRQVMYRLRDIEDRLKYIGHGSVVEELKKSLS